MTEIHKEYEENKRHQFSSALLPSVNQAYSIIIREKHQRTVVWNKDECAKAVAFVVRSLDKYFVLCHICNKTCHLATHVFKLSNIQNGGETKSRFSGAIISGQGGGWTSRSRGERENLVDSSKRAQVAPTKVATWLVAPVAVNPWTSAAQTAIHNSGVSVVSFGGIA